MLAVLAIAALSGCADEPAATPTTTTQPPVTVTTRPLATTTPTPQPSAVAPQPSAAVPTPPGCDPAPADAVASISAAFSDRSNMLADAYAITAPGGVVYIGGNIMQGTTKVSSADVWAVRNGSVYSLSGDARRRTTLPDGRDALDASAGDDYGTKVQGCVTTAERARNRAGGR
ncbi:hypothetical protein [Nocardia jiangsuensis]|uniref:Uncharacterized protein n=1 Tax=Nocardia jiangsuensis TaxID=1691563 RepID=A0ABV8DVS4_9NOCA